MLNKTKNSSYKIYQFDFGNPVKKFVSYLYQFIANLGLSILIFVFDVCVLFIISDNISNSIIIKILYTALFIPSAAVILFFIVLTFLPKKIILTDYCIKVKRNALPQADFSSGFNDYIVYSQIVSCQIYRNNIYRGKNLPFVKFNWKNLIEIKDICNRQYYIPVKNPEDFIAEVNIRVNKVKLGNTADGPLY